MMVCLTMVRLTMVRLMMVSLMMVGLMIVLLFMTMRITKVPQATNQHYGPLAILPESLTKSQWWFRERLWWWCLWILWQLWFRWCGWYWRAWSSAASREFQEHVKCTSREKWILEWIQFTFVLNVVVATIKRCRCWAAGHFLCFYLQEYSAMHCWVKSIPLWNTNIYIDIKRSLKNPTSWWISSFTH